MTGKKKQPTPRDLLKEAMDSELQALLIVPMRADGTMNISWANLSIEQVLWVREHLTRAINKHLDNSIGAPECESAISYT